MEGLTIVCVLLVLISVCQGCADTSECSDKCTDGYHEQCINSVCSCPIGRMHHCEAATKCPQGAGSGCPPLCATSCNQQVCLCKCNESK